MGVRPDTPEFDRRRRFRLPPRLGTRAGLAIPAVSMGLMLLLLILLGVAALGPFHATITRAFALF